MTWQWLWPDMITLMIMTMTMKMILTMTMIMTPQWQWYDNDYDNDYDTTMTILPVLVQVLKFLLPLLVEGEGETDSRTVYGGTGPVAEPPHPPPHLLGHDDQLRQGQPPVQVGLGPGQEEPGELRAQLVGEVSRLQDYPSEAHVTDIARERTLAGWYTLSPTFVTIKTQRKARNSFGCLELCLYGIKSMQYVNLGINVQQRNQLRMEI